MCSSDLTRDNLAKRRSVVDQSCLFCSEMETVTHLFFECAVAKQIWVMISEVFPGICMDNLLGLHQIWLSKNFTHSITTTAFLWSLWKSRNDMCFQEKKWSSLAVVWDRAISLLRSWAPLYTGSRSRILDRNLLLLNIKRGELLRIAWA